ncbi:MAG: hypothetical protein D6692_05125 [Planctomycetota bacterium]|nr:MAG: hypothetical protein D6692_05125 [Planctomycetota bacterium]
MQIQREHAHHWSSARIGSVGLLAMVASAGLAHAALPAPAGVSNSVTGTQNDGTANGERPKAMVIRTNGPVGQPFLVARPSAYKTEARLTAGFKGPLSVIAPSYTLYGEVVFHAESRKVAEAAIESVRGEFAWLNGNMVAESSIPGVYTIGARSVENAARMADLLAGVAGIETAYVNFEAPKASRGGSDPALGAQWHIFNSLDTNADHNIQAVHDAGTSGAGVVVGVLEARSGNFTSPYDPDDLATPGYDFSDVVHPDLFPNFALNLSQITDPFQVDVTHATSVAGLIGAAANSTFGRGVAFGARIAALRNGSSLEQAEAWNHELGQIDLTNNSWGPATDFYPPFGPAGVFPVAGDDVEVAFPGVGISPLNGTVELALDRGHTLGRGRKGRIHVMAAGNASHFQGFPRFSIGNAVSLPQWGFLDITGGNAGDITDFDDSGADTSGERYSGMIGDRTEYWEANSHPSTIAIAAVGEDNQRAGYSTTGTAVLAAAYSLGGSLLQPYGITGYPFADAGRGITTTNQIAAGADGDCPAALAGVPGLTCTFSGTSAAAPIATGIFALMLEANPNLTIRDIEHIIQRTSVPVNFSPVGSYWTNLIGFGNIDPDDPNVANPQFWQVNSGDVLHSDEYGFGVIDAQAAVNMARTWPGLPRTRILDSGVIEQSVAIPDAEFVEIGEYVGSDGLPKVLHQLVPGDIVFAQRELPNGSITGLACVRENYEVEKVLLTVTVTGAGAGDLLIVLESPNGSVSPLAIPRADSSGVDTGIAYNSYTFKSYKHWGELSGGTWNLYLQDFRPDDETPEGELPDDGGTPMDPSDDDPGEEHVTYLGVLGMPGAAFAEHSEKTLVSFRLEIYGTPTNVPPSLACPPTLTNCPGDLNADGRVNFADLQLFLSWYTNGDPLADVNGDGQVTFDDIYFFTNVLFVPGFCNDTGYPGNRPGPGDSAGRPVIRPI